MSGDGLRAQAIGSAVRMCCLLLQASVKRKSASHIWALMEDLSPRIGCSSPLRPYPFTDRRVVCTPGHPRRAMRDWSSEPQLAISKSHVGRNDGKEKRKKENPAMWVPGLLAGFEQEEEKAKAITYVTARPRWSHHWEKNAKCGT